MIKIHIGIDPGVVTAVAFHYMLKHTGEFLRLQSGTLIEIYQLVIDFIDTCDRIPGEKQYIFRIEDARLRKWYGAGKGTPAELARRQGAGSVKRDSAIWEEICQYHGWEYEMVHPVRGGTKWDAQTFANVTKYQGRTNQHERDAALLVYGLK